MMLKILLFFHNFSELKSKSNQNSNILLKLSINLLRWNFHLFVCSVTRVFIFFTIVKLGAATMGMVMISIWGTRYIFIVTF